MWYVLGPTLIQCRHCRGDHAFCLSCFPQLAALEGAGAHDVAKLSIFGCAGSLWVVCRSLLDREAASQGGTGGDQVCAQHMTAAALQLRVCVAAVRMRQHLAVVRLAVHAGVRC
jgi:hypothetical protein